MQTLFWAIGFNLIFLVLAVVAVLLAKPGRKWTWVLYGLGAGITFLALISSMKQLDSPKLIMGFIVFTLLLALFGVLIAKRVAEE